MTWSRVVDRWLGTRGSIVAVPSVSAADYTGSGKGATGIASWSLVGPSRSWHRGLPFAMAGLLAACGGATAPSPSPTALEIMPSEDLVMIRGSLTYSVVGAFPDGSNRQVAATWVSDTPRVATVSAGGTTTGVGAGSTTLIATANGQAASRVLRVVPDFSGTWSGPSQVTGCSAGDFRTCSRCCTDGQIRTMVLTLNQVRDAASGALQLDGPATPTAPAAAGPVSGPIQLAGSLVLQGALTNQFADGLVIAGPTLFDWSTAIDASGVSMAGHFTTIITGVSFFFPTRVSYALTLTKTGR